MEDLIAGDIIVRKRHGRWMADVVGSSKHSGGWSNPVDPVRDIQPTPRPFWRRVFGD
jgi:hypothetical protein